VNLHSVILQYEGPPIGDQTTQEECHVSILSFAFDSDVMLAELGLTVLKDREFGVSFLASTCCGSIILAALARSRHNTRSSIVEDVTYEAVWMLSVTF
jgi:hypothetical protein